ncbi:ribonuclease E inhibitor RraB [Thalassotalea psychrophila]|uniref:Ribonuclease E inhibitor RraB n=1 Tax=Thalassotalea psychrophila TaxID=3065647 RepID=A0ABY9TWQ8_9GAMM|nr:ribonuclease E inhibitor RraB [Colwelliaceae bacterium SQ149]
MMDRTDKVHSVERDVAKFPTDPNGNMLWHMAQEGDDLNRPREIQFSVIFLTQELALKFGRTLLANNQKLSFCPYLGNPEYPWEVTAYPEMEASYSNIISYQMLLETEARKYDGIYDGWYCLPQANKLS